MKKIFSVLLIAFLLFPAMAFGQSNQDSQIITYQQFLQGQKDGWIGMDVSYEELVKVQKDSLELQKTLEASSNFTKIFDSVFDLKATVPRLNPGDVIITNHTSSAGIIGHAAIALSADEILHIAGIGEKVDVLSRARFYNKYAPSDYYYIKVYRINDYNAGANAAYWADRTYRYSNASYVITGDLRTTYETYCSKIVFQAYYFGVGSAVAPYLNINNTNNFIAPYALPSELSTGSYNVSYHGDL